MFSIAPYAVELLDEGHQAVDLWNFSHKQTLRDVLFEYYSHELTNYTPISSNRLFRVAKLFESSSISVAGQYETGEYGFKSTIYDTRAKRISHQKKTTEADMLPFFFSFILPKHDLQIQRKRGMLLLSRHKTYGVRTITIPHLKAYIEHRFPGHQFNVKRIVPAALARTLLDKGTLKAIRLIKYKIPSSLEDFLDQDDRKQIQDIEIVIKAKRKSHFFSKERFMKLLEGEGQFRSLYISEDLACDNVKLDVEVGGHVKRINVGKQRVTSNIDVTDDIEIDSSGHPTLQSWFDQADSLAMSLFDSMNVDIDIKTSIANYSK